MILCSIAGQQNGLYVPCVFAVTTHKSKSTYQKIFKALTEAIEELLLLPKPNVILSDFEVAAFSSAEEIFPSARIQGCYFHFAQSIFRAIQRYGLQSTYASDLKTSTTLKLIFALAFLPDNDISSVYSLLITREPFFSSPNKNVKELLDYIERTWVGQQVRGAEGSQRSAPRFRYSLWSVYTVIINGHSRTNNSVEAWHNAINRCITSRSSTFSLNGKAIVVLHTETNTIKITITITITNC